jgi:Pentapeptide repeats (8 copies)
VQLRRVFLTIGIVIFAILVILVLWLVVDQVVWLWNAKGFNAKDLFKARNDALAIFAQILGGFALLIGLIFAWTNMVATKEGQVTDRFYKAIEQLGAADDKGKPKLELRLGGIYALERIARDSERDHWPIMEVLTAYVREHAPWKKADLPANQRNPPATDIQTILKVIGRRERSYEKGNQHLDLRWTNLNNAELTGTHLEGADLEDAHLEGAYLMGAKGVTQPQIDSANGDANTTLPPGIVMPESWTKKASG